MNRTEQTNPHLETIWKFVRGDMAAAEFERWVNSEAGLEDLLGDALYLDTVSVDYGDKRRVQEIKTALEAFARAAADPRCACITLPDLADVLMGRDSEVALRTFERQAKRGPPFWWLSAARCAECGQWWLVAQEERQNDRYYLKRLSAEQGEQIVNEHRWPADFDQYETLLRLGRERGQQFTFVDSLDRSLVWTAADLARARPGIRVSELAVLLNLEMPAARRLAEKTRQEEGVDIDLEG